jgi:hypothetical protein
MPLSRRTVLRYGLGGALLLAAGGTGIALRSTVLRRPARPLRMLDEKSFSILAAVADRIAPPGGGFPSAAELQVAEKIDALLATMHPANTHELEQALFLLENALAGLVFDGRARPFTQLDPAAQDEALRDWQLSRLAVRRKAYVAMHGLCAAAYYASPAIYPLVGYPGPPDYGNVVPR